MFNSTLSSNQDLENLLLYSQVPALPIKFDVVVLKIYIESHKENHVVLLNCECETGLIAAACGQLDSLLSQGCENKRILPMTAGNIDPPTAIIYQNGTATKAF